MFTGIIERTGVVQSTAFTGKTLIVRVSKPVSWKLSRGQSVSINGVCSTVVRSTPRAFSVEYMPETLRTTTASRLEKGSIVHLERSLRYGDPMDGHIVQGHIEGMARVTTLTNEGRSLLLSLRLPASLARYVVQRGSIALDGVSLTVARRHGPHVTVALIPHTRSHTTLGIRSVGDVVNVETDLRMRLTKHARVMPHATKPLRKNRPRTRRLRS